ncbi:MAG: hypothetical protein GQ570_09950 [Helicobacteraceae bacterium]|nr:hypothetical protein [Helicobacteraceae bacterium]
MIYLGLKFYLKANLPQPSAEFKWIRKYSNEVIAYINEKFPLDYLKDSKNRLEVKQAFVDFFEPYGYIIFQMKDGEIRIKLFGYTKKPQDSKNLKTLIAIINHNNDQVEYNYKGNSDSISIQGNLRRDIYNNANIIENEEINKKELIKYVVREALEIKQRDIVIIKKRQILIKIYTPKVQTIVNKAEKSIANRYNGINEVDLELFYKQNFSKEEDKEFCRLVAQRFSDIYFKEKKITFNTYDKYVFTYIQEIITEQFLEQFDNNEEFFKGLSGYFFRKHFGDTFEYIADIILEKVVNRDIYIERLLKIYSEDIVVFDGKRYSIPSITTEEGKRWNAISILSISKSYVNAIQNIRVLDKKLSVIRVNMKKLYVEKLNPVEYHKKYLAKKRALVEDLADAKKSLIAWGDSLYTAKTDGEKTRIKEKVEDIKINISKLTEKSEELKTKAIDKESIAKYNILEDELIPLEAKMRSENRILEQNEDKYSNMKASLKKALIAKKKLI